MPKKILAVKQMGPNFIGRCWDRCTEATANEGSTTLTFS